MRNENEKSFAGRERLFYVTIYGRQHIYTCIYTCFRYYFLAYSIFHKCNPDFTNGEKT